MTDDFESRLRDNLGQIVPAPDGELALASGARRYARRVRVVRSAVAAAAVVVIAGGGALYAVASPSGDAQPAVPPTTSPSLTSSSNVLRPYVCGDPWTPPQAMTASDGVTGGASSVRLCPIVPQAATTALREHLNRDGTGWLFSHPDDALVTDVDAFTDAVNASHPITKDVVCDDATGPLYALVFQYPNGDLESVQGDAGRCNLLAAGEFGLRGGARDVLDAYTHALLQQRTHTEPRSTDGLWTGCPDYFAAARLSVMPLGPDVKFVRAVACDYNALFSTLQGSGGLSAKQLRALNADLAQNARPISSDRGPDACPTPGSPGSLVSRMVFGYNRWGDFVGVYGGGCGSEYFLYPNWLWTPTPSTLATIESVIEPL